MLPRIECDIVPGETDQAKLATFIQRNILKIIEALVGDLQWYSQNALLVPQSFEIILIEQIAVDRFKLLYHFDWNLFSPCQDLNETIQQKEQVMFHILPGQLVFEVIDNLRPSTAEEL
jgi:hypothetical protein